MARDRETTIEKAANSARDGPVRASLRHLRTLHRDPALLLRRRARARASRAELPCRCLCINFLCSVRPARNTEKAVFSTGYSVIMITTWPNPTLNFATK
jgi:hypothetical protein